MNLWVYHNYSSGFQKKTIKSSCRLSIQRIRTKCPYYIFVSRRRQVFNIESNHEEESRTRCHKLERKAGKS